MEDHQLPFVEHLRELRKRLRTAVIALLVATGIAFAFSETLYVLLARPLITAWRDAGLGMPKLHFGSLTEPFWVYFKVSMYAGVFLAAPVLFHQLWSFIAPGLYERERRVAIPFALCSALFFIGGALFCYTFVLPPTFDFFLSYSSANIGRLQDSFGFIDTQVGAPLQVEPTLFMSQYLDLTVKMLLAFGLVFELPLLIFFLSFVGLVTHRGLWRFNKYAVILAFVVGAVLTPGPDVVSQLMMALPIIVLYNLSIIVAWVVTRRRARAARKADAALVDDVAATGNDGDAGGPTVK
ncbi:MAG: twin-arginine translocase subunit TatC [Myxococcales bacterium]|nr:twin-arginine translocase subunit TatC [Myxococcales bacterium]